MRRALPPLESLRVLVTCLRHNNFSRAAAELGLTAAAVSQRMRLLEERIGVKLFRRHGPTLTATDRAKALGQRVEHALSLVRSALDDCRRIRHPLRVTCAPTFAARWLVPRLGAYQTLPGADAIALDAAQTISPAGTFDVAIRSGAGPWPGPRAVRLLRELGTPMMSPRLAAPDTRWTVRKLLQLPLIPDARWSDWFRLAGFPNARPKLVAMRFPTYELEAQAAVKGIGVALLSPVLFSELNAQGALIAPFPQVVEGPDSYWLLWAKETSEAHFVRWMKSQFDVNDTADTRNGIGA